MLTCLFRAVANHSNAKAARNNLFYINISEDHIAGAVRPVTVVLQDLGVVTSQETDVVNNAQHTTKKL